MDNTATYSAIPGLDDGRPIFVVVAFEGVFSITSENKVFLRVQPHLLRYVLLDVDGTLPRRLSTPMRDPSCSNPPGRRFRRLDIDLARLAAAIRSALFSSFLTLQTKNRVFSLTICVMPAGT
jgi:hypothetical protein